LLTTDTTGKIIELVNSFKGHSIAVTAYANQMAGDLKNYVYNYNCLLENDCYLIARLYFKNKKGLTENG
jgi:hypothetical protein